MGISIRDGHEKMGTSRPNGQRVEFHRRGCWRFGHGQLFVTVAQRLGSIFHLVLEQSFQRLATSATSTVRSENVTKPQRLLVELGSGRVLQIKVEDSLFRIHVLQRMVEKQFASSIFG